MKYNVAFLLSLIFPFSFYSQNINACKTELQKIEEKNSIKNIKDENSVFYLNYKVRTTDWDNQTVDSNVKVYKGKGNLYFFSEQGQMFQDEKDFFLILPIQKVVIMNSTNKEMASAKFGNDFFQFRKGFIDSCEVVRCETPPQTPDIKILEMKVKDDLGGKIHVKKMIYKYNVKTEKIISTVSEYSKDYKVKKIEMVFNEVDLNNDYKFGKARKMVLDRNGRLLAKYKGYELVDDREKQKK